MEPPFKRGDRVIDVAHGKQHLAGTVFWIKQNKEDDFRYRGKRGYVKVAKKGGWTVGVEWDSQVRFPAHMVVFTDKYLQAGYLRKMTPQDEAFHKQLDERFPHPKCAKCDQLAYSQGKAEEGNILQFQCKQHFVKP